PSRGRPTQRLARQSCRREAVRRSRRIEESKGRGIEESRNRRSEESRNRGIEESRNRGIEESRNRGIEESRNRARRGAERRGSSLSSVLRLVVSSFQSENLPLPRSHPLPSPVVARHSSPTLRRSRRPIHCACS